MSFTNRSFESLSTRLDSTDPKTVITAAVEVWNRTFSPETTFLLAKSAVRATGLKGESARSFAGRIGKSHGTVGNYVKAWGLASDCTPDGDPVVAPVAKAYTIVANAKAAEIKAWKETMPEEPGKRLAWLMEADYQNLVPVVETEPEETPADETEPEETAPAEPKVSDAEGQLQVLRTLVGRIERGDFMVSEAVAFADVAKGIIAAAESFATGAVRGAGSRNAVRAGK